MNWPQKKNYLRPDTKLLRSALTLIQRKSFTGTGMVPAKNFKLNTGIPALYENMNKNKHLGTTVCENMNKKHLAEYQGPMTYPLKALASIKNLVRLPYPFKK